MREEKLQSKDLTKAADVLKSGGLLIFPTDTVYGIGSIFDNKKAVDRIYKVKGRQKSQAFPILVSDTEQVKKIAVINPTAKKLIKKFWPGGLTVILESKSSGKLGFRMPNSDIVRNLIKAVGKPIIGTSANFHGKPTPKSFDELDKKFTQQADMVLIGDCLLSIESTVVDTTVSPPEILRQGAVKI